MPDYATGVTISEWIEGWSHAEAHRGDRHFVYHFRSAPTRPGDEEDNGCVNIYVGVTSQVRQRIASHSKKWWWPAVDLRESELSAFPTRDAANDFERDLIRDLQPELNRAGRLLVVTPL